MRFSAAARAGCCLVLRTCWAIWSRTCFELRGGGALGHGLDLLVVELAQFGVSRSGDPFGVVLLAASGRSGRCGTWSSRSASVRPLVLRYLS